ncbi:MAG: hypothetical protein ABH879_10355 [archaeon]
MAEKAKMLEGAGDYHGFGKALGYPDCCVDFFVKNRPIEVLRRNDYVEPALNNSKGMEFPFCNNIFGRYFDHALMSHAPCSFNCAKSRELAKRYLKAIRATDREYAEYLEAYLKCLVIFAGDSVHLLRGNLVDRDFLYADFSSNKNDRVSEFLGKYKYVTILDRDHFLIGKEGFNYPVLHFSDL